MKKSSKNSNQSVAAAPAKPSVSAKTEAILKIAESCGIQDQLMTEIRNSDRMLCYRACLTHYRDYMLSELEDDDECSHHPEDAKRIHTFANGALNMLLSNPALPPGEMVDIMPQGEIGHCFEYDQCFNLFLFLDNLHKILFPKHTGGLTK